MSSSATATSPVRARSTGPATPTTVPRAVIEVVAAAELDLAVVPRLRETLEDALSLRPRLLVLDMSRCTFADATALGTLVAVHRQARRQGTALHLRDASARVVRTIRLCGLQRVFDLTPAR